jgi:glycosyltransferase involved in cell wall biosynthesis
MRVVFDAERLRNPNSGLGQFCAALGSALMDTRPADGAIRFIAPAAQAGLLDVEDAARRLVPTRWTMRFVAPLDAEVWHATHQDTWIRPSRGARVVLSIMDLNFLERGDYSDAKKARRLAAVQRKVDGASAIATISEFTASVVRKHLRVPDVPLRVIHLGNPMDWQRPDVRSEPIDPSLEALPAGSFLLFVGVIHPKKNIHTILPILRAFPGMSLVIAGVKDHDYASDVLQQASELGLGDRVIMPGAVNEATKRWLYENSRALVFPSLSEGFGLPVVEAMSAGKPAFLSRLTSLPEIGGDVAYYFDSFEPDAMIDVVRRGLADFDTNPARAEELRRHAERYSWRSAAMAYWSLYREVHRSRKL